MILYKSWLYVLVLFFQDWYYQLHFWINSFKLFLTLKIFFGIMVFLSFILSYSLCLLSFRDSYYIDAGSSFHSKHFPFLFHFFMNFKGSLFHLIFLLRQYLLCWFIFAYSSLVFIFWADFSFISDYFLSYIPHF